jgi:hypothetical protein
MNASDMVILSSYFTLVMVHFTAPVVSRVVSLAVMVLQKSKNLIAAGSDWVL